MTHGFFLKGSGSNRFVDWFHVFIAHLVGGLEHVFHILGMSSSQLTFILFRGVGIPPTSHVL